MRRIACAWIDEVLHFDAQAAANDYIRKPERGHRRHRTGSVDAQESGSVRVKKQYVHASSHE